MSVKNSASRATESLPVGWYLALIAIGFLVITIRLVQLQLVQGRQHMLKSLSLGIQTVETIPPRGDILDRTGEPLAQSRNVFSLLYFVPEDFRRYFPPEDFADVDGAAAAGAAWSYTYRDPGESGRHGARLKEIDSLARMLGQDYRELMARAGSEAKRLNGAQLSGFRPVTLIEELTTEQGLLLGEVQLEGMYIEQYAFKREYVLGPAAAHVIGYTGFPGEGDAEAIRSLGYDPREQVGKEGVERVYESLLHGRPGKRDIEITHSRMVRRSGDWIAREVPPMRGTDVYLTLDAGIQEKAYSILNNQTGAAIVVSLAPGHEGKLLALVSSPSYDPLRFNEPGYYNSLLARPDGSPNKSRPLLNRAYRNAFPPGSTFKIVTMTAGLQTGAYTQGSGFYCKGFIELGKYNQRFHCHKREGHGNLTLLEGLAESCDTVFYQVSLGLDNQPETLRQFGEFFGFGEPVGINLPNEAAGILPDRDWKREHYAGDRWNEVDRLWFNGDTATYGIGQSYLTATPLQVLWSAVLVALEGYKPQPQLLKSWEDSDGVSTPEQAELVRVPLDQAALRIVKSGMRLAVTSGTCKALDIPGLNVCAKSGTAETGIAGERDHSWMTGFYPMDNPEVAFVVFFQNGGEEYTAAPAARELLQYMKHKFDGSPIAAD